MIIRGDRLAVVCFVAHQPPITVAAVAAETIVEPFREALASGRRPVESSTLKIPLPPGSPQIDGRPCDIVLFDDRNGNALLDEGESFVASWTGGAGGHRVVYLSGRSQHHPGAEPGWSLIEGGFPLTYQTGFGDVRVLINPVVPSIPGG